MAFHDLTAHSYLSLVSTLLMLVLVTGIPAAMAAQNLQEKEEKITGQPREPQVGLQAAAFIIPWPRLTLGFPDGPV